WSGLPLGKWPATSKYAPGHVNRTRRAKMRGSTCQETMQFKHVTLDFDGPVAVLRLGHQEVMNAVSMDMLEGLAEALDAIDDKKAEVRCVVLTGAGRACWSGD